MASKVLRAIIMGAPGSGKGTIAKRIVGDFDLKFLSSGDILRTPQQQESEIGKECEKYIKHGALVPDRIINAMVFNELRLLQGQSWILDGFPRNIAQAEALQTPDTKPTVVIELVVPFEVIIERLKGRWIHVPSGRVYNMDFNKPKVPGKDDVTGEPLVQRVDDHPETVMARLQAYKNQTIAVSEFYKKREILAEFHGRESNEIWPHVRQFLAKLHEPVHENTYK